MKNQCLQMYENMIAEIGLRRSHTSTNSQWIEDCFQVSLKACNHLQELADTYPFADIQEEIWFYKVMKPQFAGQMEYFTLLYMVEVFAPEDMSQRINYWNHELKKSRDFFSKHESFYQYYKQGHTDLDPTWFVRASTYSDLAATIIAREKYLDYLKAKISDSSN